MNRIRRIKCDEGKPCCHKCQSTGRKCDGYAPTEEPKPQTAKRAHPSRALAANTGSNVLEQQAFSFFRICTGPGLAGYFRGGAWDHIILQLSHTEPAIFHALNAISGLHREMLVQRGIAVYGSQRRPDFPLHQYAKALKRLRTLLRTDNASSDVVLACSLLCIHFEAIQENFLSVMVHFENMTRVLHQQDKSKGLGQVHSSISQALIQIDIQCSVYREVVFQPWRVWFPKRA